MIASIIHEDNIDTPLSITTYKQSDLCCDKLSKLSEDERYIHELSLQDTYYYHRDNQGSIIALTDKEGDIVESFIYDESYGKILEHKKEVQTHNPYAYTARELDQEDLYYYRARYYDPQTGRFLSQDPIQYLSGDFNWYRYVGNNPTNFIDPSGLVLTAAIPVTDALLGQVAKKAMQKVAQKLAQQAIKHTVGLPDGVTWTQEPIPVGRDYVGQRERERIKASQKSKAATSSKSTAGNVSVTGEKGKSKDPECGKRQDYKSSKKEFASNIDKEKFERDHMSSGASLIKNAMDKVKNTEGVDMTMCLIDDILNSATTVMMPLDDHKKTRTFKRNNNEAQIREDAKDLKVAKENDAEHLKKQLEEEKKKPQSKKRDECIKKILDTLNSDEFKKHDPQDKVDEMLEKHNEEENPDFKKCKRKLSKRWKKFLNKYKD